MNNEILEYRKRLKFNKRFDFISSIIDFCLISIIFYSITFSILEKLEVYHPYWSSFGLLFLYWKTITKLKK